MQLTLALVLLAVVALEAAPALRNSDKDDKRGGVSSAIQGNFHRSMHSPMFQRAYRQPSPERRTADDRKESKHVVSKKQFPFLELPNHQQQHTPSWADHASINNNNYYYDQNNDEDCEYYTYDYYPDHCYEYFNYYYNYYYPYYNTRTDRKREQKNKMAASKRTSRSLNHKKDTADKVKVAKSQDEVDLHKLAKDKRTKHHADKKAVHSPYRKTLVTAKNEAKDLDRDDKGYYYYYYYYPYYYYDIKDKKSQVDNHQDKRSSGNSHLKKDESDKARVVKSKDEFDLQRLAKDKRSKHHSPTTADKKSMNIHHKKAAVRKGPPTDIHKDKKRTYKLDSHQLHKNGLAEHGVKKSALKHHKKSDVKDAALFQALKRYMQESVDALEN